MKDNYQLIKRIQFGAVIIIWVLVGLLYYFVFDIKSAIKENQRTLEERVYDAHNRIIQNQDTIKMLIKQSASHE